MKFLREWLRIDRPSGIAPHASETIEVDCTGAQAFAQCVAGIETVLGGVVRDADERVGRIEATFGLIDSERLTCTITPLGGSRARVVIESRRGASPQPAKPSQYVRTLAAFLRPAER